MSCRWGLIRGGTRERSVLAELAVQCSSLPHQPGLAWLCCCRTRSPRMGWSKAHIYRGINRFNWNSDIVAENPDKFNVVALAAGSNATLLADQVKTFKPQLVAVRNESLIDELKEALADSDHKLEIIPGGEGVIEVARQPDSVTVVTGIGGCAGLKLKEG